MIVKKTFLNSFNKIYYCIKFLYLFLNHFYFFFRLSASSLKIHSITSAKPSKLNSNLSSAFGNNKKAYPLAIKYSLAN